YCAVRGELERAQERARALEREAEGLRRAAAEQEERHKSMYLKILLLTMCTGVRPQSSQQSFCSGTPAAAAGCRERAGEHEGQHIAPPPFQSVLDPCARAQSPFAQSSQRPYFCFGSKTASQRERNR
ncbi:Uncharacterized protein GBIM_14204, partial [Gryllus bimaculatus]